MTLAGFIKLYIYIYIWYWIWNIEILLLLINLCFRGSNFSIVEDTQLFLTERKDGIYAYVSFTAKFYSLDFFLSLIILLWVNILPGCVIFHRFTILLFMIFMLVVL